MPRWQSENGDRVRVVVGSYEDVSSALVPAEPFNLLDVTLQREISFGVQNGHYGLVYVLEGGILVRAEGREQKAAERARAGAPGRRRMRDDRSRRARSLAHLVRRSNPRTSLGGWALHHE